MNNSPNYFSSRESEDKEKANLYMERMPGLKQVLPSLMVYGLSKEEFVRKIKQFNVGKNLEGGYKKDYIKLGNGREIGMYWNEKGLTLGYQLSAKDLENNTSLNLINKVNTVFNARKDLLLDQIRIPKAGEKIRLKKIVLNSNSGVAIGKELYGTLKNEIIPGRNIELREGGNTTAVQTVQKREGKIVISTETSQYELIV